MTDTQTAPAPQTYADDPLYESELSDGAHTLRATVDTGPDGNLWSVLTVENDVGRMWQVGWEMDAARWRTLRSMANSALWTLEGGER